MKHYIPLLVTLLILTTPFFQLQSQTTTDQTQPVFDVATSAVNTSSVATTSDELSVPRVDLKPGVRHKEVKALQKLLQSMGYLPESLQLTEVFGPKTRSALIRFQKSQGLPATGIFDQATRLALENYLQQKVMVKKELKVKKPLLGVSGADKFFANLVSQLDRNVSTTCMKLAVEKRESAIVSAWEAYAAKIKSAYETRKNELVGAWTIVDPKQRQTAIKNAWSKYHEAVKTAQTEWRQLRYNTWTQFTQEAKNCKASIVEPQEIDEVKTAE